MLTNCAWTNGYIHTVLAEEARDLTRLCSEIEGNREWLCDVPVCFLLGTKAHQKCPDLNLTQNMDPTGSRTIVDLPIQLSMTTHQK